MAKKEYSDAEYENYYRKGYIYSHGSDPLDPDSETQCEEDDDWDDDYWDRYDFYRKDREAWE